MFRWYMGAFDVFYYSKLNGTIVGFVMYKYIVLNMVKCNSEGVSYVQP